MNQAGTPIDLGQIIANAELHPLTLEFASGKRETVNPPALRSVLLTLWRHDQRPVSIERVATETGCGIATAFRAIRCMIRDGMLIVRQEGSPQMPATYQISADRLREYAPKSAA